MKQLEPKFVGVDQAEALTGISRWTWRRMAYAGKIASAKVGKRLLLPMGELDRILAENYRPALMDGDR